MSKKMWVPVTGYGLVLSPDEMILLAEEREADGSELADEFNFTDFYGFDGTVYPLRDSGCLNSEEEKNVESYDFYILQCDNTETVFGQGYENLDEMITEIKGKTADLFPEGFDYRGHIKYVSGVIFDN